MTHGRVRNPIIEEPTWPPMHAKDTTDGNLNLRGKFDRSIRLICAFPGLVIILFTSIYYRVWSCLILCHYWYIIIIILWNMLLGEGKRIDYGRNCSFYGSYYTCKLELHTYRKNRHPRVKFDVDCVDDSSNLCMHCRAGQARLAKPGWSKLYGDDWKEEEKEEEKSRVNNKRKRYEPVGESNAYGRDRHS